MLDEPLGSLDRTLRERLIEELRDLLVDHAITAVYVTHDQEEAFTIADRILVLRDGAVAQEGTPEAIYRKPADEWIARFLGFRNIVRAEVTDGTARTPWVELEAGSATNGPGTFVIPPDGILLTESGSTSGTIISRSFRGGHYLLQVGVTDGPTLDVEVSGEAPEVGAQVSLRLDSAVQI